MSENKLRLVKELLESFVQELKEERDEWKDAAQSYYITNQELREQNKRYREAIEKARRELETCARSAYLTLSKALESENK